MKILVLTVALFGFHGCTPKVPVQPPGDTRSEPALGAATDQRESKVAAYVAVALEANEGNPAGRPKEVTRQSLGVARSYLKPAFEADLKAAQETAANSKWDLALLESSNLRAQLADLQAKVKQERIDGERIHKEQLDAVRSEQKKAMLAKLSYVLLGMGVLFTIVGALQGYAMVQTGDIGPKGLIKPFVWAGAAAFCFACYWTVNQPWFVWVIGIGSGLGLIAGIAFIWSEWHSAKRGVEANEAEATLKRIIAGIDASGSGTIEDLKNFLGRSMNDGSKALIHELRAEDKR